LGQSHKGKEPWARAIRAKAKAKAITSKGKSLRLYNEFYKGFDLLERPSWFWKESSFTGKYTRMGYINGADLCP